MLSQKNYQQYESRKTEASGEDSVMCQSSDVASHRLGLGRLLSGRRGRSALFLPLRAVLFDFLFFVVQSNTVVSLKNKILEGGGKSLRDQ